MRKHFLLLFLSILMTTLLTAQTYPKYPSYRAKVDKGYMHYHSQTKKAIKNQEYRQAAINSLLAYNVTDKKKKLQKIDLLAQEAYPLAIEKSTQTIQHLRQSAESAPIDKKVALLYEVTRVYDELGYLQNIFNDVQDKTSLTSKTATDYKVSLEEAEENLQVTKTQAAAFHYQNAMILGNNDHWKHRLAKARALKIAHHYDRDYQDVKDQYLAARKEGQVVLQVNFIKNNSQYRANSEQSLLAISAINSGLRNKKYEFIRLAKEGESPDIIVDMTLTNVEIGRLIETDYESERVKVMDEKKEIVAKAKFITYQQGIYASLDYDYTFTDAHTGAVLTTEKSRLNSISVFEDSWYSYKGDSRALSKSELRKVKEDRRPEPVPSSATMFNTTLSTLTNQLAEHVIDFTNPYGY